MAQSIILCDPDVQGGVLVFHGTRVPVKNLFAHLEAGESLEQFPHSFPSASVARKKRSVLGGLGPFRDYMCTWLTAFAVLRVTDNQPALLR